MSRSPNWAALAGKLNDTSRQWFNTISGATDSHVTARQLHEAVDYQVDGEWREMYGSPLVNKLLGIRRSQPSQDEERVWKQQRVWEIANSDLDEVREVYEAYVFDPDHEGELRE